ncbi:GntR family transcriptional regulator [Pseudonocardia spirodelae]|uniref:GntR family transcriptional regulator n=1 Tax=Pseudonocardia spirodelae TaxID=3133431 RepID=A0ABU8T1N9_9PSEU
MDGHGAGSPRYGSADGKARRVLAALRGDIVAGELAQGERLTEASLCARYRVSRVPVREALRTLAVQGFVEIRPNQGATVATIDGADAEDLFAVRGTIEQATASRCADRVAAGDGEVAGLLGRVVADGEAELAAGRTARLPELNTRFHLTMAECSGSASMTSLLRQVADRIEWIYAMGVTLAGPRSWAEHRAILTAIEAGDRTTAGTLARAHVERAERHYRQLG